MRKPNNPFIVSGYHSPPYFCDRKVELAWLTDQFDNERNAVEKKDFIIYEANGYTLHDTLLRRWLQCL